MGIEEVLPGVYQIGMLYVNAFLIVQDEVTLIDSGLPNRKETILKALTLAEKKPDNLKHIAITHHHVDHTGSLAALVEATGAKAYIHPLDAPIVRGDRPAPKPGTMLGRIIDRVAHPKLEPIQEYQDANDGDQLAIAGGMNAIHTPGHTAGHLSFLWPQHGGVLFTGDAAANIFRGPAPPVGAIGGSFTEDAAAAKESFRKLAALEFDAACFGHGGVIKGQAHAAFRRAVEKMAR
jgi:glyoxylase-like metal-dependent hydrolase (beta-lactamase superfamily II)